ncbi:MAG: Fpg/Nei family DNA glycosylase [Gemmatimonadota bacterium]
MPELPEVHAYLKALEPRVMGATIEAVRLRSVASLKTYDPPLTAAVGRRVTRLRRLGKRIVVELGDDLFLALHLMIAGRLSWFEQPAQVPAKRGIAAFDFSTGSLLMTEEGAKRRASIHLVRGEEALAEFDAGGVKPLEASLEAFRASLQRERHTLKRTLTDPRAFSGIGGAYADEILHRARLSPLEMSDRLTGEEVERLWRATREVLADWIAIRLEETGEGFPAKVSAFHPRMAVHGKYREPCPVCGTPIQRIVYAERETNYCPRCQTEGRVLADRALSRLLKDDWPRTIEELEEIRRFR